MEVVDVNDDVVAKVEKDGGEGFALNDFELAEEDFHLEDFPKGGD